MPSNVPKRQPRLKESCDHCSSAKVRCTKDKPACSRCAQKGFECTYSHSRRAGRRNMNATDSPHRTQSVTSSQRMSQGSPDSISDDSSSDGYDMWTGADPIPNTFDPPTLPGFWEDDHMYGLQHTHFVPTSAPMSFAPAASMITDSALTASPTHPFHSIPLPAFDDIPPSLLSAPLMSRTSSVSSHQADAVSDELTNLTAFADLMEKKFDAVVKTRLQYRDVYSEFGIPVDELESGGGSPAFPDVEGFAAKKAGAVPGYVPAPDASELAFYYSLAEMKRRLKWLREDFGTMMATSL